MSIEADRQEAAEAAYGYYTKALTTGRPIGPVAPLSSFFDERTGTYQFFSPGLARYATYSKLRRPEYYSQAASGFGPVLPGRGAFMAHLPNSLHEAHIEFNHAVMRPNEFSYAVIFDMQSPTWSIPLNEWPQGRQVSAGAGWY